MAAALLDDAKQKFADGQKRQAFCLAFLAWYSYPSFPDTERYHAVYRVHYKATKKADSGLPNYYAVLGLKPNPSLHVDAITDAFRRLANLIHPDIFRSPAAPEAFRLIKNAWELLCDDKRRQSYDICMGLRFPPYKPQTDQMQSRGIKRRLSNADADVIRVVRAR